MAPVGLATAGVEAGNIVNNGAEMSARLAVPITIVGYFVVGIALFMGIILYTLSFLTAVEANQWTRQQSEASQLHRTCLSFSPTFLTGLARFEGSLLAI